MFDVAGKVIGLFDDLISRGEQIKDACKKMYFGGAKKGVDVQAFEAWRTSCLTLLRSTFGTSSPHCNSFNNTKFFDHYNSTLLYLGILQGAREDLRRGYFYHKDLMLSINIFNSFLSRAKLSAEKGEMGKAAQQVSPEEMERQFKRTEAIINSMTPGERRDPDVLNASRRRRIAAGSGNQVQDVNRLIKQFREMQRLMKTLQKGGGRGLSRLFG